MKLFYSLVIALGVSILSFAQTTNKTVPSDKIFVNGLVTDKISKAPKQGAEISLFRRVIDTLPDGSLSMRTIAEAIDLNTTFITDENGDYSIPISKGEIGNYLMLKIQLQNYDGGVYSFFRIEKDITVYQLDFPLIKNVLTQSEREELDLIIWNEKRQLEIEKLKDISKAPTGENHNSNQSRGGCSYTVPANVNVLNLHNGYNSTSCSGTGFTGSINFDEYVAGVVQGEMSGFPFEAKKAQAIAARTYSMHRIYVSGYTYANCGQAYNSGYTATTSLTASYNTSTMILLYNGNIINSLYSARCNGNYTQNANQGTFDPYNNCNLTGAVTPYLQSVTCSGHINCNSTTETPCCNVIISTAGTLGYIYGHGVGMCQRGAQGFSSSQTFDQILTHFYTGVCIANSSGGSCPQPTNDYCSTPYTLSTGSSCSYTQGTTCGATPPTNGLSTSCSTNTPPDDDVWYQFSATSTSSTITLQPITSTFDGVIELMSGTCPNSLSNVACANSFGAGSTETLAATGLTIGNTYFIRIFSNGTGIANTGDFNVCITSSSTCIPVSITNQPSNQSVTVGGTATFSVVAGGTAPFTYQWFKNGSPISGATNSSYTTPILSISDNGNTYYCQVTNCNGANLNISNTVVLTVSSSCIAVTIATQPTNQYTTVGNTATFYVSVNGTSPITFQWYQNGNPISGATNSFYTTPTLSLSDNGNTYYCYFTNCNGINNATSNTVTVNVTNTCNTPATPVPTSGTSSCPGTALYSTTFSIGWTNSNSNYDLQIEEYPYGSSNIVYTQNCLTTFYPQISNSNIIAGKLYRYSVRATTDCNTCNSSYSQPYYFHIAPEIYPSGVVYVCNGTGTTLSTPTITVPNGGNVSYQWYFGISGNATPISGANSDTYFATQSGTYFVKLTYSGSSLCGGSVTTSQSLNVYVNISTTPNAPTLSSNSPVCEGSTLTLSTPVVGGYSYHWTGPNGFTSNNNTFNIPTVSSAYAGTYSCYLVNNGCQSPTSTTNVVVNPAPTASFTYNVVGTTATFTNTSANATSYNWNFGDSQSSTQTSPSHTYSNDNYYTVCLTANNNGCNPNTNCQQVLIGSGSSGTSSTAFANIYWEQNTLRQYIASDVVQSTIDSGYICIGAVTDTGSISNYGQYFKADKNGNIVWARELPGNSSFVSKSIVQSQSGYLLCFNYNFNNLNVLMEIDEQGNKLWSKTYTDNNFAVIDKIFRINAGGFFAYGRAGTGYDRLLMKFDNSGNIVWQTSFLYTVFTQTEISISSIIQTNDGGFVLVGDVRDNSVFPSGPTRDMILIKVNSSGIHQWTKQIGMAGSSDNGYSVYEKSNGELVVGGFSFGYGGWLLMLNSSGTSINSSYIPATSSPLQIFQLSSGNYATMFGFRITELDASFNVVSSKIVKAQAVVAVKKTLDDNFIIAGYYYDNPNTYNYRYNLIKDGINISNCLDSAITLSSQSITLPSSSISPTVTTPTLVATTYAGNPYLITLVDSNFCHVCNLAANITPSGNTTFCSGGSVTLTADAGMASYLWSNGQTTQSINVTQAGNYSVAITDGFSCPATSQPVSVTVNPLPIADAGNNQSICIGSNAVIGTAQIQGNTYSWSPTIDLNNSQIATPTASPTSTTPYTVTVTNSFGCTSTDQATVTVNSLPTVDAGSDVTISQGNSTTIGGSPTASGNNPFSYSWTPFSDLSSAIASNPVASPLSTTDYIVAVTDNNGCINIDTITVTVNPVGCTYSLSDSSHAYNYLGGSHIFTVTTSSSNCTWTVSNSNNWFQVSPSTQQTGNASVTITADSCSNGVPRSGTFTVAGITYTVTQTCNTGTSCNPPVADFAASQTTGNCPFTVDFFDLSQTTGTTTYTWTIYNGTGSPIISSAQNPTGILYNVLGNYLVKLEITDSCGTDTKIVANYITVNCTVGIDNIGQPTTFLVYPNPTNDVLNIVGSDLPNDNYKVSLTNVLGQLLFQDDLTISDNKIEKQIGVKQFSSGIYFLTIGSPNVRQVFKINKQ